MSFIDEMHALFQVISHCGQIHFDDVLIYSRTQ